MAPLEKQIYAFTEKRQNVSTGSTSPQMFLMGSTRLDPLSYMLFGAYRIDVTERGLECDGWLPVIGNIDALDDIQRLKTLMESCMLRVFEGVSRTRRRGRSSRGFETVPRVARPRDSTDEGSGDEDDPQARDHTLSGTEVKELDFLTRDIVRILDRYNEERLGNQSRRASRAGKWSLTRRFLQLKLGHASISNAAAITCPWTLAASFFSCSGTWLPLRVFDALQHWFGVFFQTRDT